MLCQPPPSRLELETLACYLPPGSQVALLELITNWAVGRRRGSAARCFIVQGDLNIDPGRVDTEAERDMVAALHRFEEACEIHPIRMPGPTRRQGLQEGQLDYFGVSRAHAWEWAAKLEWHPQLSDHAICHLRQQAGLAIARSCTP